LQFESKWQCGRNRERTIPVTATSAGSASATQPLAFRSQNPVLLASSSTFVSISVWSGLSGRAHYRFCFHSSVLIPLHSRGVFAAETSLIAIEVWISLRHHCLPVVASPKVSIPGFFQT
jgi:hypothetical protein